MRHKRAWQINVSRPPLSAPLIRGSHNSSIQVFSTQKPFHDPLAQSPILQEETLSPRKGKCLLAPRSISRCPKIPGVLGTLSCWQACAPREEREPTVIIVSRGNHGHAEGPLTLIGCLLLTRSSNIYSSGPLSAPRGTSLSTPSPHSPTPSLLISQMTWFHRDCQDLMTQLRLGKAQRTSPGDQRRLHRYLQRLASEFPEEKLTAMGLQVASLSREGLGQDLWEEAWVRHEEIQTLLKKAVAHCPCPAGPTAHSAHPEPRGAATKGQGLNAEVTSKGRRDLPLQHPLGLDSSPKSCWPPWAPRVGRNRNFLVGPQTREAGQAVEAEDGEGPREPLDPAPERSLATLFSWQRLARQGQSPRPTGGSFSSEGTDSQTSLEDSPQTSPPASL